MKQWMVARRKLLLGATAMLVAGLAIGGASLATATDAKQAKADCTASCPKGTPCTPCPDCSLPSCPKRCD
jgi:hypothetical protein